jgi:hypothetical protein
MSILDELRQEQQRLSERLTKIDLDRAKLAEQIAELVPLHRDYDSLAVCG